MNSNLTVKSYSPSFSAITKISAPEKFLSKNDIAELTAIGQKLGITRVLLN